MDVDNELTTGVVSTMTNDEEIDRLREAFMEETKETCCGNTWFGPAANVAKANHQALVHSRVFLGTTPENPLYEPGTGPKE